MTSGNLFILGILGLFVIGVLFADRLGGEAPLPAGITHAQYRIVKLQKVAVWSSVIYFFIMLMIQPQSRIVWLVGTAGFYFAGLSALLTGVSAFRFHIRRSNSIGLQIGPRMPKRIGVPTTGPHAMATGIALLSIAGVLTYLIFTFSLPQST
jgi:hypothetical protein